MSTDITLLMQRLVLAAAKGCCQTLLPDDCRALVEALEAKQPHHNGMMQLSNELVMAKQRIAELENDEVRQRLANAEHQLHMAELAKHNLKASRKAQFRKRKVAEKRIAELTEFLSHIKKCLVKNREYAPLSHEEIDTLLGIRADGKGAAH